MVKRLKEGKRLNLFPYNAPIACHVCGEVFQLERGDRWRVVFKRAGGWPTTIETRCPNPYCDSLVMATGDGPLASDR